MRSLKDLDAAAMAGQLLWIGFHGTTWSPALARLVRDVKPGGIILFGRNIEGARQVRALNDAAYRALDIPPFVALDQEGGRVSRLRSIVGATSAALALAARPEPRGSVKRHSTATALALKTLGFNVNFAPVLDLSGADARNGIGDRAFGEDPADVCRLAEIVLRVHLQAGIVPVGKHFPGLGGARADSHLILPVIRRSREQIWKRDLLPYRRLRSLLPVIMVGHAYYPALQGRGAGPATLSARVVDGLLRRRMRYRGLILTDDLEMGAIDQRLAGGETALAAFAAGGDGLMFCSSADRILEAHEALRRAIEQRALPPARLRASLHRVLRLKERQLVRRRRGRYSIGSMARSRLLLESLAPQISAGIDPTARA